MKVLPFKIPKPNADAIVYQEDRDVLFYNKLHQHEEYQISYIVEGRGTLIVGDTINNYMAGDIIVIGSHLPHVFKSEVENNQISLMLSLFFTKSLLDDHFLRIEELKSISPFFKRAEHGFKAISHQQKIRELFLEFKDAQKLKRFIYLLEILDLLSRSKYKSLSSFVYQREFSDLEGKRMREVVEYTISHFNELITLSDVALKASMTKNAFCKYFKKRTNKTYIQFLNELRVEHACSALTSRPEENIAGIAEQSGFNNISNFNRKFKEVKGITPSEFRQLR